MRGVTRQHVEYVAQVDVGIELVKASRRDQPQDVGSGLAVIVLLPVQRSGDSGSPHVTGSTSVSSAGTSPSPGCVTSWRRLPRPLRRTLTASSERTGSDLCFPAYGTDRKPGRSRDRGVPHPGAWQNFATPQAIGPDWARRRRTGDRANLRRRLQGHVIQVEVSLSS